MHGLGPGVEVWPLLLATRSVHSAACGRPQHGPGEASEVSARCTHWGAVLTQQEGGGGSPKGQGNYMLSQVRSFLCVSP